LTPQETAKKSINDISLSLATDGLDESTIDRCCGCYASGFEHGFKAAIEYAVEVCLPRAIHSVNGSDGSTNSCFLDSSNGSATSCGSDGSGTS